MQAKWGIAWLVMALWLSVALGAPTPVVAGNYPGWKSSSGVFLPLLPVEAQGSLETQMLGEKPLPSPNPNFPGAFLPDMPSLQVHPDGDATLMLPRNLELNISFRYNRDPNPAEPQRLSESPLYMKYSVDYRLLSNLRVGLNGYLFRPAEEGFAFQNPLGNRLMGFGPQLKYDLGRWSFLVKSQVETGNLNRSEDLQNWFRVWYAF